MLSLSFPRHENRVPVAAVEMGEAIRAGQLLAAADDRWRSPVAGEVVGLRSHADLRGGRPGLAVLIEPSETDDAGLHIVDLWRRVDESNNVLFVFKVASLDRAREFINDPDAANTGAVSGVIDGEIHFVESAPGY